MVDAQKRNAELAAAYASGRTMQQVAEQFGITRSRVQQILKRAGVRGQHHENRELREATEARLSKQTADMVQLRITGHTVKEIEKLVGKSNSCVVRSLRVYGLAKPTRRLMYDASGVLHFQCAECKCFIPEVEFPHYPSSKTAHSLCRTCCTVRATRWRDSNRDRYNKYQSEYAKLQARRRRMARNKAAEKMKTLIVQETSQ